MDKETSLKRFVDAQQSDYQTALTEIKSGRKRSHWMWYIFPQIQGLGFSETSRYYAMRDLTEAQEYLDHPVLGPRLIQICDELLKLKTNSASQVFGDPDDMKLRSSMTLFAAAKHTNTVFQQVLDKFFNGQQDNKTLQIINK